MTTGKNNNKNNNKKTMKSNMRRNKLSKKQNNSNKPLHDLINIRNICKLNEY